MNLSEYPEPQGPPSQPDVPQSQAASTPAAPTQPAPSRTAPTPGQPIEYAYPAPRPGASSSRRFPVWIAAMVAVVLFGAIASFVVTRDDDRNSERANRSEQSDNAPAESNPEPSQGADPADQDSSGSPESTPRLDPSDGVLGDANHIGCEAGTLTVLCELIEFVEVERGRPFKTFPIIELQEDDEFDDVLLAQFDEESGELEEGSHVLRSLGLIPEDADLVPLFRSMLEVSVVGYYSPEDHNLVIRGGEFDLYSQLTLVHELTHAHDDQWLDLDRPEFEDANDERASGFLAIVEGNASRVEDAWRDSLSEADQLALNSSELTQLSPEDIETILALPPFMLEMQFSPYQDGPVLVNAIFEEGGEDAVDEAFANPPLSTEQVLHPEQYLNGESVPVQPIPSAPRGADIVDEGVVGELAIRSWLGSTAAEGWNGDGYVTWLDGNETCTIAEIFADTDQDLQEVLDAAQDWARQGNDRSVDALSDAVRIQGCVG